ncbi:MAG: hypothetical protein Q9178_008026 [Gyalolechia marmorata]
MSPMAYTSSLDRVSEADESIGLGSDTLNRDAASHLPEEMNGLLDSSIADGHTTPPTSAPKSVFSHDEPDGPPAAPLGQDPLSANTTGKYEGFSAFLTSPDINHERCSSECPKDPVTTACQNASGSEVYHNNPHCRNNFPHAEYPYNEAYDFVDSTGARLPGRLHIDQNRRDELRRAMSLQDFYSATERKQLATRQNSEDGTVHGGVSVPKHELSTAQSEVLRARRSFFYEYFGLSGMGEAMGPRGWPNGYGYANGKAHSADLPWSVRGGNMVHAPSTRAFGPLPRCREEVYRKHRGWYGRLCGLDIHGDLEMGQDGDDEKYGCGYRQGHFMKKQPLGKRVRVVGPWMIILVLLGFCVYLGGQVGGLGGGEVVHQGLKGPYGRDGGVVFPQLDPAAPDFLKWGEK